jgi:hypothetical protein
MNGWAVLEVHQKLTSTFTKLDCEMVDSIRTANPDKVNNETKEKVCWMGKNTHEEGMDTKKVIIYLIWKESDAKATIKEWSGKNSKTYVI